MTTTESTVAPALAIADQARELRRAVSLIAEAVQAFEKSGEIDGLSHLRDALRFATGRRDSLDAAELAAFRHGLESISPEPVTYRAHTLQPLERLAHGLTLCRDLEGKYVLHDGTIYRGYAHNNWSNRKGEPRWLVEAWGPQGSDKRFSRGTYLTEGGARAALIRAGAATAGQP